MEPLDHTPKGHIKPLIPSQTSVSTASGCLKRPFLQLNSDTQKTFLGSIVPWF